MEKIQLAVTQRDKLGKGASNRFRESGFIPAILYGQGDNLPLLINGKDFRAALGSHSWSNLLFTLQVEGVDKKPLALIREIQSHPLSGQLVHIDFFEISSNHKVQVNVHLKFAGTPIGVKQGGGILSHQRREIKVEALPDNIPDEIEVDISGVDVGQSLHVRDIQPGEGIIIKDEARITICVVNKPKESAKETTEEAEAAAEAPETEKPAAEKK